MKVLKSLLCLGLVLFFSAIFSLEARAEVVAPEITELTNGKNFTITGIASKNSEVLIYLDGNFVSQAETVINKDELVFNFRYKEAENLADGTHIVMAIAKDRTSLVLSAPSNEVKFTVNVLPAPTLIAPNEKIITAKVKPLIIGLTKSGSFVKIFIDGIYNGKTEILNHQSGTANFAYEPFLNLSRGQHEVYAVAEDGLGKISQPSEIFYFNIEAPMPAPTMLKPVVNGNTTDNRPFIVGLAKNDSKIKVYIDKKFNGEFQVKNHQSGTANFAYKPIKPLARGSHLVYAVAVDQRGKESNWSNIVYFSTKNSAIAESAQEENSNVANTEVPAIPKTLSTVEEKASELTVGQTELQDNKIKQADESSLEKIKDFIGAGIKDKSNNNRGMINEGEFNQGRLKLSLILFILFLVGVIAWLLWVNRELVKERQMQNEVEELSAAEASENKKNKEDKLL
ncbi:MAG: hypothetical protein WC349_04485 [Patescibacteria group bacterium]|jgi:hypothetical protein